MSQQLTLDDARIRTIIKQRKAVQLGKGNYGKVWKIHYDGVDIAVKEFTDYEQKTVKREISCLNQISKVLQGSAEAANKHFISLLKFCDAGAQRERPMVIIEFAPCGSLREFLFPGSQTVPKAYKIGLALSWCEQIADAVDFLHGLQLADIYEDIPPTEPPKLKPVIHRDLKPANVLMFEHYRLIKLCDFGLARLDVSWQKTSGAGTPDFMAPEVFLGEKYSTSCDVYSLGVTVYQVIHRDNEVRTLRKTTFQQDQTPEYLKLVYRTCARAQAANRPTMRIVKSVLTRLLARCPAELMQIPADDPDGFSSLPEGIETLARIWPPADAHLLWADFEQFDRWQN